MLQNVLEQQRRTPVCIIASTDQGNVDLVQLWNSCAKQKIPSTDCAGDCHEHLLST